MTTIITDEATAKAALHKVRDDLVKAVANATMTTATLRGTIVTLRPKGILAVDEMADAVGRDRNYVDSVWSGFGDTTKGKQTRVTADATEEERQDALNRLASAAHNQRGTATTVGVIRAERDRVVAMVYASKILGPSAIAAAVDVDRNHVLRIARKSKVAPVWRPAGSARNQHSAKA